MSMKVMNGLDLSSTQIHNVADPSVSTDAATKNYVDNLVNGLNWHQHVRVASTANVTVSSPGTSIDGVTLNNGDRVLLKNQTTGSENGIYTFNGSASAMTRTTDGAQGNLTANSTAYVAEGTTNADTAWTVTTNDPITVGTTALAFAQVGGGTTYTAGNGISISSNTISVNNGAGLTFSGAQLVVDHNVVPKKYTVTLGASATSYTITHSLGTQDVTVAVYQAATPYNVVYPDVAYTDANTVTLTFASAPSTGAYKVVVIG